MFKIAKIKPDNVKDFNLKDLFPDITKEMNIKLNQKLLLKKEIIDFIGKDKVGVQFSAIRICKIPEDPAPIEKEVEDLEFEIIELENDDPDSKKLKNLKKKLYSKNKLLEKLKHPYKYFDDICECYTACPFYREGMAPVGEPCYIESHKVSQATASYLSEFQTDLMTQTVAKEQISQIVLCDLIIYRASRALAVSNLSSISEKVGEMGVEYTKQRNHLINLINEENKTRNKLLETMLGTPEIKKKYKIESKKSMRQVTAEQKTAELIQSKERVIKKSKMPTLIDLEDVEVID